MDKQHNINIYFGSDNGAESAGDGVGTTNAVSITDTNKPKGSKETFEERTTRERKALMLSIGAQIGHQTISTITQNVGMWTGSSEAQNKVNAGMNVIGMGMAFAVNPIFGLINMVANLTNKILVYAHEKSIDDKRVTQGRERAGAHYNHSR